MSAVDRRGLIAAAVTGLLTPTVTRAAGRRAILDPRDFGARGDGVQDDTKPIQAAIDAAAARGGGVVRLRPGVYLSGSVFVKSNVTLDIAKGATLRGGATIGAYPELPTRIAGIEMTWPAALVNAYRVKNAAIIGEGTVDGNGKPFWDSYWTLRKSYDPRGLRWAADYDCKRPRLVQVFDCDHVRVAGLHLERAGFWTLHVCYSRDIEASDLVITNNLDGLGPSTDGIDIDSSERVLVKRCDISVNDDALCMKAGRDADGLRVARPCRDITVRDCIVRVAHAGFTFGSETSGGFERIDASGLTFLRDVPVGLLIKSAHTRGGYVRDAKISNVVVKGTPVVMRIDLNWLPEYSYARIPAGLTDTPPYYHVMATPVPRERGIPHVRGLHIANVRADGAKRAFEIAAFPEAPLEDFTFEHLRIDAADAGSIANARRWRFVDAAVRGRDGKPPRLVDAQDVTGLGAA